MSKKLRNIISKGVQMGTAGVYMYAAGVGQAIHGNPELHYKSNPVHAQQAIDYQTHQRTRSIKNRLRQTVKTPDPPQGDIERHGEEFEARQQRTIQDINLQLKTAPKDEIKRYMNRKRKI